MKLNFQKLEYSPIMFAKLNLTIFTLLHLSHLAYGQNPSFPSISIQLLNGYIKYSDWFTKGDPFVRVHVGSNYIGTTNVEDNTNGPKWMSKFRAFNVKTDDEIVFKVYDDDYFSDSDYIGTATSSIGDMLEERKNGKIQTLYISRDEFISVKISWAIPSDCGKTYWESHSSRFKSLTYDDTIADDLEFPWMGSLQKKTNGTKLDHFCGATLINPEWLLTSAQCVYGIDLIKTPVYVVLGNHDVNMEKKSESYRLDQIILHKDFDFDNNGDDIALVHTDQRILGSRRINSICLPSRDMKSGLLLTTGWGNSDISEASSKLRKFHVLLRDSKNCENLFKESELKSHWDEDKFYCALTTGQGNKGDYGGPLIGYKRGRAYILGVNSLRIPLMMRKISDIRGNNARIPSTFVRVFNFLEWIEEHATY